MSIAETAAALSNDSVLYHGQVCNIDIVDPSNPRERERAVLLYLINSIDIAIFFPCEYPKSCQKKTRCADILAMLRSAYDHFPEFNH